jgi:hypothetical protein
VVYSSSGLDSVFKGILDSWLVGGIVAIEKDRYTESACHHGIVCIACVVG